MDDYDQDLLDGDELVMRNKPLNDRPDPHRGGHTTKHQSTLFWLDVHDPSQHTSLGRVPLAFASSPSPPDHLVLSLHADTPSKLELPRKRGLRVRLTFRRGPKQQTTLFDVGLAELIGLQENNTNNHSDNNAHEDREQEEADEDTPQQQPQQQQQQQRSVKHEGVSIAKAGELLVDQDKGALVLALDTLEVLVDKAAFCEQ